MKKILALLPLITLTACTSYQEGFDCAAVPGVGCKSITEVDRLIDQGKLGAEENAASIKEDSAQLRQFVRGNNPSRGVHVWMAPYEDEEGTWHDSQSLFVPLTNKQEARH